jgi:hypothetical protein
LQILGGEVLDYLFLDGGHTYGGVQSDSQVYSPLARSGGIVAFHDIATSRKESKCEVAKFWSEIKNHYRHLEIIEGLNSGSPPIAVTGASM